MSTIRTWLELLDELVAGDERPATLLAHSLAASLWLTHLARGGSPGRVTRLALVAIPSPTVLRATHTRREGGGHLVPDSGFGPWPRILEWALVGEKLPS